MNKSIFLNIGAFVGCYQDGFPRDLNYLLLDNNPNMTLEYCAAVCYQNGFKYAGLQAGYIKKILNIFNYWYK